MTISINTDSTNNLIDALEKEQRNFNSFKIAQLSAYLKTGKNLNYILTKIKQR